MTASAPDNTYLFVITTLLAGVLWAAMKRVNTNDVRKQDR